MSEPQLGTLVGGRYRLERKLGQGGMGSVFAATDAQLHRVVAIKLLHPALLADRDALSRFAQEARALAALGHPHIAALHDFQDHGASPFLVMELLEGESLRALMARERVLAPARAVHIVRQVLAALGAAHRLGIIHRDVKPSNIMLVRSPVVADLTKLLDFGVAKMAEGRPGQHQTVAGAVIGTLQYMAPEQALGRAVTPSADLFATALCLFEMIAGYNPYAVGDAAAVLAALRDRVPPSLAQIRADVAPPLAHVVARALASDPRARFASAEELSAALSAALAPPTGVMPSMGSSGVPLGTMTQPPATLVDPASRYATAAPSSLAPAQTMAPAAAPARWPLLVFAALFALGGIGFGAFAMMRMGAPAPGATSTSASVAPAPSVSFSAARLADSAPAASASARPPAGGAARSSKTAVADAGTKPATAGGSCRCFAANGIPDRTWMCHNVDPQPRCLCGEGTTACPVPMTQGPNGNAQCSGATTRHYIAGAKPGGACTGYVRVGEPAVPLTYGCNMCRAEDRVYSGKPGDSCSGVNDADGKRYSGFLGCD